MKPIRFACPETLQMSPEEVAGSILDLSHWCSFKGYAILPGIQSATYELRTPDVIGSRIRVLNTDGSSHVEEIVEWEPDRVVRLRMKEFTRPLSYMAIEFVESWEMKRIANATEVNRSFEMFPKSFVARLPLWLISRLLRRAIVRHLRELRKPRMRTPSD